MTDIAALLHSSLPGLYRDKDADGELRAFLELMALPLSELEASIAQLREDLMIETCRPELIPLIGGLVGAEVSASLPPRAQRDQVRDAIPFYRSKGLAAPLVAFAEEVTGWRVEGVDFSQRVALFPYVTSLAPVEALRGRSPGESAPGSGFFTFRADGAPRALFDARTGRAITRVALAANGANYAGADDRFTISERGVDLFTGPPARTALAADLSNFAQPKSPGGGALAIPATAVAVDPELGRFRVGAAGTLAGNLRVSYHALVPASVRPQALDVRDPSKAERIGRSDDPVPYTLDLRTPEHVSDRAGHQHFDNHGFFCTPAVVVNGRRPNALPPGSESGNFSFDDRPLAVGDGAGVPLQLLDGIDGAPLTRRRLSGHEAQLAGSPRAFTIRVGTLDPGTLRVRAANLTDFAQPRDTAGNALALAGMDVAVDPQLGRFMLDLSAFGTAAGDVRVDYLVAPAVAVETERSPRLAPDLYAFDPAGTDVPLVDGYDGTRIGHALRLGAPAARYHGTARGWTVRRNGAAVSLALTLLDLGDVATPAPANRLAVDVERGRFRFPAGFLAAGDRVAAGAWTADEEGQALVFESLAQQLPRATPAGVVPRIADTRLPRRNGAYLT